MTWRCLVCNEQIVTIGIPDAVQTGSPGPRSSPGRGGALREIHDLRFSTNRIGGTGATSSRPERASRRYRSQAGNDRVLTCGRLKDTLQAVPIVHPRRVIARMEKIELLQEEVAAAIVAGRACQVDVLELATAAARMGKDMIVWRPHELERRVLGCIRITPCDRVGIFPAQGSPNFAPDHRDLAEPAVMTVPPVDETSRFLRRRPRLRSPLLRKRRG